MTLKSLKRTLQSLKFAKVLEPLNNDRKEEIIEALKKNETNDSDIDSKVKNYSIRLSKLLAYAILEYRLNKLYDFLENNLLNINYLNLVSSLESKIQKRQAEKMKMLMIQTKEEIPPIFADDGFSYGPLKDGDIVFISESFSSILLKKKLAKEIV